LATHVDDVGTRDQQRAMWPASECAMSAHTHDLQSNLNAAVSFTRGFNQALHTLLLSTYASGTPYRQALAGGAATHRLHRTLAGWMPNGPGQHRCITKAAPSDFTHASMVEHTPGTYADSTR
jgi:hypothetical protein